jgi:aldose 1-epimerase
MGIKARDNAPTIESGASMKLRLSQQDLVCELRPDLGGCIAGLWLDQEPVLRSTPAEQLHSVRNSGCYPLVPFSNRIAQAKLVWNGTSHPLVRNFNDEPHAIHGVGWQRPWTVLDHSPDSALISYEHRPDSHWPFAFDVSQAFALQGHSLQMSLSITNQSDQPAPVGLGWHPYFVKRTGSHVRFTATGRWEMGPDKLPTVRQAVTGLDCDCEPLQIDNCFDGWRGDAQLHDAVLHTQIEANMQHLVVYTHPELPVVAIEPVSHVNNALHLSGQSKGLAHRAGVNQADPLGLRVAQPGESFGVQMTIRTRRV